MHTSVICLAACALLLGACANEDDEFLDQIRAQGGQYQQTADQFEEALELIEDGEDMIDDGKSDVKRGRSLIERGEEAQAKGKQMVQKGQLLKTQIETMMIRPQQPSSFGYSAPATVPYPGY